MDWKNLAIRALLGTSLLAMGCGDDDGMTPADTGAGNDTGVAQDAGDDAPMSMPLPGECADGSCFFVADAIIAPEADGNMLLGANIDGRVSDANDVEGCSKADFVHPRTSEEGIDNALAPLLVAIGGIASDLDIQGSIDESIAGGSLLLLMKLEGADGTEDSEVMGNIYLGQIPGDAAPMLDGDGTLTAGQTIDLNSAPIAIPGAITGGRFVASASNLPLSISLSDMSITLNISNASISADVTADGLVNGEITGALIVDELVTSLGPLLPDGIPMSTLVAVLGGQADLNPDDTGVCGSLSVGLGFNAIDAVEGADVSGS